METKEEKNPDDDAVVVLVSYHRSGIQDRRAVVVVVVVVGRDAGESADTCGIGHLDQRKDSCIVCMRPWSWTMLGCRRDRWPPLRLLPESSSRW